MLQHPGGSFVGRSFGTAGLVNSTIWLPSHAVSFLNSQELGNASPNTFAPQKVPFWCFCSRFEATIRGTKF